MPKAQSKPAKKTSPPGKLRVFIADDHPLMRLALRTVINQQPDLAVCGEADTAHGAIQGIERQRPDVALVDLSLKDGDGLDLLKDLRIRCPDTKSLVLSMHDEAFYAERVLRAGALGFVSKNEASQRVVEGIRQVAGGKLFLSEKSKARLITKTLPNSQRREHLSPDSLSDREIEVLDYVGRGFASGEIAEALGLSVKTVETHRGHIKEKLGLRDAPQLVKYAFHWVQSRRKPEPKPVLEASSGSGRKRSPHRPR
ncbi:MAG: response regulator transcription factor [Verrucomicrobia bacterium]|nr:response regulator transcription factor [Verrucomicrobiota bacterium]